MKGLPNQAKRLQEQKDWMRSYKQLRAWERIVIISDDEEEQARQITMSSVENYDVECLLSSLEAEMGFPVSQAYNLPRNAKSVVGS